MGTLRLGRLARGEARPLTAAELRVLRAHAEALRPAPRLPVDPEGPAPRRGRAGPRL
jgi:hypothetical protein